MTSLDAIVDDPKQAATLSPELRRALTLRAAAALAVLAAVPAEAAPPAVAMNGDRVRACQAGEAPDEYLSIRALAGRIPYDEQTIRNLMSKGTLKLGVHYFKVGGKGRPIFKWAAVRAWLEGQA